MANTTFFFKELPDFFFEQIMATPLPNPYWIGWSKQTEGLFQTKHQIKKDYLWLNYLSGNTHFNNQAYLATAYSGHQFGQWAGKLGDGRALLLGTFEANTNTNFLEIQLKGSGKTPFSRMGDGRAVLRSSIREFLCSEAMDALNIPTTRALGIVGSNLAVQRETQETAAVVARVAPSFIRFGHFEHCHANQEIGYLTNLVDYTIKNFYPQCKDASHPYLEFLNCVVKCTAQLVAHWQSVGFCHGVMNTDNMSILGLTLDYGPFGFLDSYDPHHICNHSDTSGRYAFDQQPMIAHWNLYAFAEALLPLLPSIEETKNILDGFLSYFQTHYQHLMRQKLGLIQHHQQDPTLWLNLFKLMQDNMSDFTRVFRGLCHIKQHESINDHCFLDEFINRASASLWLTQYKTRLIKENSQDITRQELMFKVNPKYILRNYLLELAIQDAKQAIQHNPISPVFNEVEKLLTIMSKPFEEQPEFETYAALPPVWSKSLSISCSS